MQGLIKYTSLLVLLIFASCIKEVNIDKQQSTDYDYKINDVTIRKQSANGKPNIKSTQEFISIAYFDLFESNISQTQLTKLNTIYSAFGDRKLIEDMIIKNFLNNGMLVIPTNTQMRADIKTFVNNCYKKFYTRKPTTSEQTEIMTQITSNTNITPVMVYYSFLTSNEYRHY